MRRVYAIIILLFIGFPGLSQFSNDFNGQVKLLRAKKIASIEVTINQSKLESIEKDFILWEVNYLRDGIVDSLLHNNIKNYNIESSKDSLLQKIHFGKFEFANNEYSKSYDHYKNALSQAISSKDSLLSSIILNDIIELTNRVKDINHLKPKYVRLYREYAPNSTEMTLANYFWFYEKSKQTKKVDLDSLKYEISLAQKANCSFCKIRLYQRVAGVFNVLEKQKDSAIKYNLRALELVKKEKQYDHILQIKKGLLNNLGRIYSDRGNHILAIDYLKEALSIKSNKDRLINDLIILENITLANKEVKNFEDALFYFEKSVEIDKEFGEKRHSIEIRELEERYENSELKRDNLAIEKQSADQKNLIIILILVLVGSIGVLILGYVAFKRKQHLLQQEKNLLLKEQELQSIDAMVEGQEKERQRIANELHDNLGGLLATLKLYVQNLKVKKNTLDAQHDIIIKNTDEVLEEAYQKVRSIAQTRNAGVLTSEGLVPTIQNYATKVSASNSLIVEVSDYGMEQRLNNSMEITIFRIIQELITNVIKHANAKEITIDITNHQNSINIMVEDDGSGFDIELTKFKKGMGLSSIRKRVENLRGTLKIDTHIGKGTTIIIDIPLE